MLVSTDGAESAPTAVPLTIDPTPVAPKSTAGGLGIDVEVQGNRVFYGAERKAQVSALMTARRAVGAGLKAGDDQAVAEARAKVDAAKRNEKARRKR